MNETDRNPQADGLIQSDRAALAARKAWVTLATHPTRDGKQLPPKDRPFNILLWRSGRGFGKTKSIIEQLWWDCWRYPNLLAHMLEPTLSDVQKVAFEGPAGFKACVPPEVLFGGSWDQAFNSTKRELYFANGSLITGFACLEEGRRLRGPQCHILGGDEVAQWDHPAGNLEEAFSNAIFGLRLPYPDGTPSRAYLGTTPRPIAFLKKLEARPDVIVVRGTTYENASNLSQNFLSQVMIYEGTRMGEQEISGEYLEDGMGTIFQRSWFPLWPAEKKLPEFNFIVEVYDTAMSEENYDAKKQTADFTASIVLGVFNVKGCFTEAEIKRLGVRSKYAALICDAWQERIGFPALLDKARTQHRTKWGSPGRRADVVLIEQKGSGISLRQSLMKYGVPTWPYNPGRMSKTMRAHAASPAVQQRMVFVPESMVPARKGQPRDWIEPFLEQVCAFAGRGSVAHDDLLDVLTSGVLYLMGKEMFEIAPDKKYLDREEKKERDEEEAVRLKASSAPRDSAYGA